MRLEIQFFLVIVILYILMGIVLQDVNPFIPLCSRSSKKTQTNLQLNAVDLFKNG